MKYFAPFLAFFLLGCGVDGAPTPPEPKAQTGLVLSGQIKAGIAKRSN